MQKISSSVKNSIRPDCAQFINITTEIIDGKDIVRVNVVKGTHQPYYLGEKGMRPSGVFIRVGSSTMQAQEETIRKLVSRADGVNYEDNIAFRQDLTFATAKQVFSDLNVEFTEPKKKILGLLTLNGFYTNLALLISDQCTHSIKCSIFEGLDKQVFKDRKEFGGSLFTQIDEVLSYINVYNKTKTVIGSKLRSETRDYPEDAVREAIINAVVHRDYAMSGSTLVSIYDDRLEIVSLGGLTDGISKEDIMIGVSQPRNPKLANIFYRLKYIESYGTGIPRIFGHYSNAEVKPQINTTDGVFQLIIPNQSYKANPEVNTRESKVIKYLESHEYVTKEEAAELFGVQPARAYILLEQMVNDKLLRCEKSGKKKIYFIFKA